MSPDSTGPDSAENAYVFERAVPLHDADGCVTAGKIDLHRRDRFVLEAKQTAGSTRPENQIAADVELTLNPLASSAVERDFYGKAMLEARSQAERYARNLPDSELPPRPPPSAAKLPPPNSPRGLSAPRKKRFPKSSPPSSSLAALTETKNAVPSPPPDLPA